MKKRILTILLSVCMVVCSVMWPTESELVYSSENGMSDYTCNTLDDGTIEILLYSGDEESLVIPSAIDGKNVTSIGTYAFRRAETTSTVVLEGVTNIGYGAFLNCPNLTNITLPESLTNIGISAFGSCWSLTNIIIPSGVKSIGEGAFSNCSKLASMIIPDGVVDIGEYAFFGCSNFENIIIPDKVINIKKQAFANCSNLKTVNLPEGLQTIESFAFGSCTNIEDVYYAGSKEQWENVEIGSQNTVLLNTTIHYGKASSGTPSGSQDKVSRLHILNISTPSVTYTGKAQTPSITVTDTNGQTVAASNYTVSYANNKNVGRATVTVTGKGTYKGTLTATFDIVPKGTKLSKVTAKKKTFTAKWKKQTKETTGYEVQYSINKSFEGAKLKAVKKNKTTFLTVKKLKPKKKYYVRIRTYKTMKGEKFYSDWSKVKTVKVKKLLF